MKISSVSDPHLADLVQSVVSAGGHLAVRMRGESMTPTIRHHDVVVLGPRRGDEPTAQQIVVVRANGKLLAHRVKSASATHVVTRGDSCDADDGEWAKECVLAMVREVHRCRGARRWLWRFQLALSGVKRRFAATLLDDARPS